MIREFYQRSGCVPVGSERDCLGLGAYASLG